MTIYIGNISDKPSPNHLAGQLRHIDGATDNQKLAQAFGISGRAGLTASNGKVSLIDLFPQDGNGTVYVDPGDLERTNDLDFISQHLSMITDYAALTRFMVESYPSEVQLKLREISAFSNFDSLTNEAQKAIVKYYFGLISSSEVRKIVGQQRSIDQFKDGIGRIVLGKQSQLNFSIHGLEILASLKAAHFELNLVQHSIEIKYKIIDSEIKGSARQIRGSNSKSQKAQFKYFAKMARNLARLIASGNTSVKLTYNHTYRDTMFSNQIQNELVDKMARDFDNIKRQIKNIFNQVNPHDIGIDQFNNYNSATAFSYLWSELGLSNSEVNTSNIDAVSVRQWFAKEISLEKFLLINEKALVSKLQKAIIKRYSPEHIDYDAYINRSIEYAKEDLRSIETTKLVDMARPIAHKVINEYVSNMSGISDIHQLLDVYHTPARQNDFKIIENISNSLIEHVGQIQAKDNPDLKNRINKLVTEKLPKAANERWEIFLQHQNIVLGSFLDQKLAQEYLNETINDHVNKILAKARQLNVQNAEDYVDQYINQNTISEIDRYYQTHFDYQKAVLAIKQNILDNLMNTIPYSKMKKSYWFGILQAINDYDQIKQYQHADNLNEFINRYAPHFKDDIKSQVSLSPQKIYNKFISNIQSITQQYIVTPINQILISKDAPIYKDLPNKAKAEVSGIIQDTINAIENDFSTYVYDINIYPQDTARTIISKYLKTEAGNLITAQLEKLDWNLLVKNVFQYEDNLKQSKQILLGMTESLFSVGQVGYQNIYELVQKKLYDHLFTDKIISLDQSQEIKRNIIKIIDNIKNKFNIVVCQEEEKKLLDKLSDGGINYVGFVIEWIQHSTRYINKVIEQEFDWNHLAELGRDEFIQRIKDDTMADRSRIISVLNEIVPGEEINTMTDNLLLELENKLMENELDTELMEDEKENEEQKILNAFDKWYLDNYLTNYLNPNSIFVQTNAYLKLELSHIRTTDNLADLNKTFDQMFSSDFNDFAINEADRIIQENVPTKYAEIVASGNVQMHLIDDIKLVQKLITFEKYLALVFPE